MSPLIAVAGGSALAQLMRVLPAVVFPYTSKRTKRCSQAKKNESCRSHWSLSPYRFAKSEALQAVEQEQVCGKHISMHAQEVQLRIQSCAQNAYAQLAVASGIQL
eukprot:14866-Heterococcus_DN1.PRE.5